MNSAKAMILSLGFFIAMQANAVEISRSTQSECLNQLDSEISHQQIELDQRYLSFENKSSPTKIGLPEINRSQLLIPDSTGYQEGIILFHGFNASPFEVENLGVHLRDLGYVVYMPLISGFGGSYHSANQFKYSDWQNSYKESYGRFSKCFDKVHVGGFSLGGGLTLDFLLSENDLSKIKSVTLIAPYTKAKQKGALFLGKLIDVFQNGISFETLYDLTESPDLLPILENPTRYVDQFPVSAGVEIAKFGRHLKKHSNQFGGPVFVALSESDDTIDLNSMKDFVSTHLVNFSYYVHPKSIGTPHQMLVRTASNPLIEETLDEVAQFITYWSKETPPPLSP
ncbi:MAG: alpha/beta hydrolase [Bdellovibrionales bacterium]|nr:alpha/beta hydrolase [Bdellovibrionales bacterium]